MADFPPCDDTCGALEEHVRRFFAGQPLTAVTWEGGPIRQLNPHFRVLRVGPVTEPGLWQYISVGGWAATEAGDWGLPVTGAERDFKAANGLEALESRFERARLNYWDVGRRSVT